MQIEIHTKNLILPDSSQERIERRIRHIYRHLDEDVNKITLRVHNESGVGQNFAGFCQVQVQARGLPDIYAEQKSNDLYTSVLAVSTRAKLNVSRRVTKFNRLITKIRKLKTHKYKHKTLRLDKHGYHLAGEY